MRKVLNISVPKNIADTAKDRAKRHGFESISEYVRFLLDLDNDLISPKALLAMSKRADQEYKSGKMRQVDSLADLM